MAATRKCCPNCGETLSKDAIAFGKCSACGRVLPEELFRTSFEDNVEEIEGESPEEPGQDSERKNLAATAALVAGILAVMLAILSALLFGPFIRESALELSQWQESEDRNEWLKPLAKKARNNLSRLVVPTALAGVAAICTLTALLLGFTALLIREVARARAIVGLVLAVLTPALFWALVKIILRSALTATDI